MTVVLVPVSTARVPVRSFRPRRRSMSPARTAAYEQALPTWRLPADGPLLDLAELFPGQADVVLEIGFGGGEGLVAMAAARPHEAVIGVEVHTPGIARVVAAVEEHGWTHVRVVDDDVLEFLPRVPLGSLAGIRLWFPDPWPKQRQRHRRIVRPEVITDWVDRLRLGGSLHIATDITDYVEHTEVVVAGEPRLAGGPVTRPDWRPLTRFEERGLAEGRHPVDLWYEKIA